MLAGICLAFVLPHAFGKPAKSGKPLESKVVYDLVEKGAKLSSQDAERLEASVKAKPDDVESKIQLVSYYASLTNAEDWNAIKATRVAHILWFIEHDPKVGFGLFQVSKGLYRLHCVGDPLADPAGFELVAHAWLNQLDKHPKDDVVLGQTIEAIEYCKPEVAEKLLLARQDAASLGKLYASAVLGLNGQSYATYDVGLSLPELRQSAFAKHAYSTLDSSKNAEMLAAAAIRVLATGGQLWADGKLDWDYTPFGTKLLTMARAEGSNALMLSTLQTTLPARGERPPVMLRVGGNVQAVNLIRKVTPRYPDAARQRRITGTVRMTALIGLDGRVLNLELVSGPRELVDASLEAARQWIYKPTLLNGKPVYVLTRLDINYEVSSF